MAERYLIDTSAVIKYLNNTFSAEGLLIIDKIIDQECLLSFITEVELQSWNPPNNQDLTVYIDFINQSTIYYVDNDIIKETIRIRKNYGIKIPDAFIAATALVNKLTLIADNDKDFLKISSLKYINPNKI
jgi:predicted nucleic acid-binding protein